MRFSATTKLLVLLAIALFCCSTPQLGAQLLHSEVHCPVCNIDFRAIQGRETISNRIALDGKVLDSPLVPLPACPLCGGIFAENSYSAAEIAQLERAVWTKDYQQIRQESSYFRLARLMELSGGRALQLALAWQKVYWSEAPESAKFHEALKKSADYFSQHLISQGSEFDETGARLRLVYADILRQLGEFTAASAELDRVAKLNHSEFKRIIRIEKELLEQRNSAATELPAGNLLHQAVYDNNQQQCQKLAKNIELATEPDINGLTALHLAVKLQRDALVRILAANPAVIDLKDRSGNTALQRAVNLKAPGLVASLLKAGAAVNASNKAGKLAVQLAARSGAAEVFMLLVKAGADMQSKDPGGNNLLHLVCAGTDPARERMATVILANNVAVNERNYSDYTPLHIAVTSGSRALIDLLLAAGARLDARLPDGRSALFICRQEFIGLLLERNADLHLRNNAGRTAFVEALLSQDGERIAAFKASGRYGVEPKALQIGNEAVTLWEAAAAGNLAQLRGILQAEASQVQRREVQFGETALHRAVLAERAAAVEVLLAAGAQPSAGNHLWRTPLHYAAATGNLRVVQMLVAAGSNIFALDVRGSTPLHEAAAARHTEVYEFLRRHGAIDSTRNNNGLSAAEMLKQSAGTK